MTVQDIPGDVEESLRDLRHKLLNEQQTVMNLRYILERLYRNPSDASIRRLVEENLI